VLIGLRSLHSEDQGTVAFGRFAPARPSVRTVELIVLIANALATIPRFVALPVRGSSVRGPSAPVTQEINL